MSHFLQLEYYIPSTTCKDEAVAVIDDFIQESLDEFGCLPRDSTVMNFVVNKFGKGSEKSIVIMKVLTDNQLMSSVCDRSEFKHPDTVKLSRKQKRKLKDISQTKVGGTRKRRKKFPKYTCTICLESIERRKLLVLQCNCKYHYKCIKKWLGCKKECPTCQEKVIL